MPLASWLKRWNSLGISSGAIPGPSSLTSQTSLASPSCRALIRMWPWGGANFKALLMKLLRTRSMRCASMGTIKGSLAPSISSSRPRSTSRGWTLVAVSWISAPRSASAHRSWKVPASIRARSSRSFTMNSRRRVARSICPRYSRCLGVSSPPTPSSRNSE
ncbi:hypothetical protein D3C87_1685160 [compost metagenome]